ncbi:unnamed protein product, partial [Rotaria magnacalcarata]
RIGQLIINPVGRSKEFFIKHNQPLPNSDFLKQASSENIEKSTQESSSFNDKQSSVEKKIQIDRCIPLGRGHQIHTKPPSLL